MPFSIWRNVSFPRDRFDSDTASQAVCYCASTQALLLRACVLAQLSLHKLSFHTVRDRRWYRETVSASQTSLPQAFSKASPYDKKSLRWIKMTNAVTVYLCKDIVPFQDYDRKGFKEMVQKRSFPHTLQPN